MGKNHRRKSSKRARARRRKQLIRRGIVICAGVLMVFLIMTFVKMYQLRKLPADQVTEGVSIEGEDISGMTADQVEQVILRLQETYGKNELTLKVEDAEVKVPLSGMGFAIRDPKKLAREAVAVGKEGSVWKRSRQIRRAKRKGIELSASYELEEEAAAAALKEYCLPFEQEAQNAQIHREGDDFVITEEQPGRTIDTKKSREKIETYLNKKWKKKGGSVTVFSVEDQPEITKEQLAVIDAELGSFYTYCGSGEPRVQNVETGSARISGSVLLPGEEFSADAAMRPYTEENGYTEAGSYENGAVVQSMGGGICQVSTTLYNAVLYAELEVTQRQPHSLTVDYVSPSRDAAIADDIKDLKFKNNTEAPVYIECEVTNERLYVRIYGKESRPEGRSVEFESEELGTIEPENEYRTCEEVIGYIGITSYGHTGKSAQLWKIVYENGEEVSRDVINESHYSMSPNIVSVGISSSNDEAAALVRNAVSTQKRDAIDAAIAEAQRIEAGGYNEPESTEMEE